MKKIIKTPAFWVIISLIIFGLIAVLVLMKEEKYGYLLLSDISSYKCTKKECKKIENTKIIEDTQKGNFQVFQNFESVGLYRVDYITKWNFFDSNNTWENITSSYIAGTESLELEVKKYETRTMNPDELAILQKHLNENDITTYTSLEQNEVLEYDFNKNGKNEKIILASNVNDETDDEKLFAIVIQIVNNKSSVLHIDVYNQYENYEVPSYSIKGIISMFNQKEDHLILLKGYFSEVGLPSTYLYKVEKNKFETLDNSK